MEAVRPRGQLSIATGIVVAVGSVALITVLIYPLKEAVPVVSTSVLYLLPVLLVAGYWGLWLALPTAVVSAFAWNFFHIPPTGRFGVAEEENWVALAVFLVAAVVVSALADAGRSRAQEAEHRRTEADLLAEMGRILLGTGSVEESLSAVGQRIAHAYDLPSVTIELAWVDSDARRRALPLIVGGNRIGTVLVPAGTRRSVLDALQDRVIPGLETLVGAVRQRDELESQVIETKALRRSNVMKTTLLRSVSHDLRSPLTAITAAADGLASETLSEESRRELAAVIRSETARLSRLVDNLLDLTRIQAGSVAPRLDWVGLDEVVQAAIDSVTGPPAGFDVQIDPDLPALNADATQLERAIANVLENASQFAGGEPVSVRARTGGRLLLLRISDHGPGIPREDLERVFEPFHRAREAGGAGSGLGLAIARGFLEANGGRIRAESLPGQGTSFVIQFPLPAPAPVPAS